MINIAHSSPLFVYSQTWTSAVVVHIHKQNLFVYTCIACLIFTDDPGKHGTEALTGMVLSTCYAIFLNSLRPSDAYMRQ